MSGREARSDCQFSDAQSLIVGNGPNALHRRKFIVSKSELRIIVCGSASLQRTRSRGTCSYYCTARALESGDTASVIEMRVRIDYQPDVFHSEAKLRDTG